MFISYWKYVFCCLLLKQELIHISSTKIWLSSSAFSVTGNRDVTHGNRPSSCITDARSLDHWSSVIREFFPLNPDMTSECFLNTVFQRATTIMQRQLVRWNLFWHASSTLFCPLSLLRLCLDESFKENASWNTDQRCLPLRIIFLLMLIVSSASWKQ